MKTGLRVIRFTTLTSKLIGISLVFLIIPSLILGLVSYYVARSQLNTQSEIALKNYVQLVNSTIKILNTQVQEGHMSKAQAQEDVKRMILGPKGSNGLRPINPNYNIGNNRGFFFILDKKGNSLASPTSEGQNLWNSKDSHGFYMMRAVIKTAEHGGGYTQYIWPLPGHPNELENKIVYSAQAPAWGWIVAVGAYTPDFNSGANQVLHSMYVTFIISSVLGILLVVLFSRQIINPIKEMDKSLALVSDGDLSGELLRIKSKDEIGRLAEGFNKMKESLKFLILRVTETSEQVAASAEQLTTTIEESTKATEQITMTIQDAAQGAYKQTANIEESQRFVLDMTEQMGHIAETSQTVSRTAKDASTKALEGNEAVQSVTQQMNGIDAAVNDLSGIVHTLGEQSRKIGQIVDTITHIADQTNLLSLNAAIEAAKAGESGRGFAVVADEVRKLAEQSAASAKEITGLINSMQESTEHVVIQTGNTTKQVEDGLKAVNSARRAFEEIHQSIEAVREQVEAVSAAARELSDKAKQLNVGMEQVAQVSVSTSAGMQHISASTEEQLAASEEIRASAESLAELAGQLQEVVNQFKI
ncbi:methyl-accepting chemotaxis protein [Alicyclobacillus herbarius]|uniref:methyl-accepting chemotaxis protein n=1 Tax=Alicyclobacillus herbarius TaxID=122960 RepID=UPI00041BA164|nr:methyl-accepting chemotaxis protein [Alicyclobacillus herbarius]